MHAPNEERIGGLASPGIGTMRGVVVILTAIAIGAFVVTQGLSEDARTEAVASVDASSDDETADGEAAGGEAAEDTTVDGAAEATLDTGVAPGETAPETGVTTGDSTVDGTTTTQPTDTTGDTTPPASPVAQQPADVMVLVLNAAGAKGVAGRGAEVLQSAGYDVLAPKNAEALGPSQILYTEGFEQEANALAAVFAVDPLQVVGPLDPLAKPISDTRDAHVVVVIGQDDLIDV